MSPLLDLSASASGQSPKGARIKRVTTGCLDCRRRRVKCPEGVIDLRGRKAPCARCTQGGLQCWYPREGGAGKEWIKAGDDDQGEVLRDDVSRASGKRKEREESLEWLWNAIPDLFPSASSPISVPSPRAVRPRQCSTTVTTRSSQRAISVLGPDTLDWSIEDLSSNPFAFDITQSDRRDLATRSASLPSDPADFMPSQSPLLVDSPYVDLLRVWSSPSPSVGLGASPLSSLPSQPLERRIIAYFETRGCNEIISVNDHRANWIHCALFPRLQALLVGTVPTGPGKAIRDYAYHSILRLSFVHRGNKDTDIARRASLKEQARSHRDKASYALIKAKVAYSENSWRNEEYLIGFFVACMADMLDSHKVVIDPTTAFELPPDKSGSDFTASLRDMIGVYSTVLTACTPHDPLMMSSLPNGSISHFELARDGSEWVERFFGITRPMIRLLGEVNWLVMHRGSLLRAGLDLKSGLPSLMLLNQAEKLSSDLGTGWLFNETMQPSGKSRRIQRGTEVFRQAILTMILCEMLDVKLNDYRLEQARQSALELVADTDPDETAGYSLPLTLIAVYTPDPGVQAQFGKLMRSAQDWSFGPGFHGVDELLAVCWKMLAEDGKYPHGIAPWRELLSACGRSIYL